MYNILNLQIKKKYNTCISIQILKIGHISPRIICFNRTEMRAKVYLFSFFALKKILGLRTQTFVGIDVLLILHLIIIYQYLWFELFCLLVSYGELWIRVITLSGAGGPALGVPRGARRPSCGRRVHPTSSTIHCAHLEPSL